MNHNRTELFLAPLAASALIFSLAACGSDDAATSDSAAEMTETTTQTTTPTTTADDMAEMPGGEASVGDITVTDAWVRQPADGQPASVAYGTITNNGDSDITLVGGSVALGATVGIHETLTGDDGVMQMQEREDGFVIAAGGTLQLEPGGPHLMMLDTDPADFVDSVDLTLIFDDGTEITVMAPVRSIDGMDMGGDMTETTDG